MVKIDVRCKKFKVFLVNASCQISMAMAKICLLKKLQIKSNSDNSTGKLLKVFIKPYFIFRYDFQCFILEQL